MLYAAAQSYLFVRSFISNPFIKSKQKKIALPDTIRLALVDPVSGVFRYLFEFSMYAWCDQIWNERGEKNIFIKIVMFYGRWFFCVLFGIELFSNMHILLELTCKITDMMWYQKTRSFTLFLPLTHVVCLQTKSNIVTLDFKRAHL